MSVNHYTSEIVHVVMSVISNEVAKVHKIVPLQHYNHFARLVSSCSSFLSTSSSSCVVCFVGFQAACRQRGWVAAEGGMVAVRAEQARGSPPLSAIRPSFTPLPWCALQSGTCLSAFSVNCLPERCSRSRRFHSDTSAAPALRALPVCQSSD